MCGIIGVTAVPDAARQVYLGLYSLQHRGQEAAGIVAVDGEGVARSHRGKGLMTQLIEAAADYARKRGATLLEGYPSDPRRRTADTFIYTGTLGAFERAGFKVAAQPSKAVRIMRRAA